MTNDALAAEVDAIFEPPKRGSNTMLALSAILLAMAISALVSFLYGLILMLTVMVVHDHWLPSVPTIGYWVAVLVAFTVRTLFVAPTPSSA
jgi:hypothetical protein